ncbi:MAG: hypothetical protein ABIH89_02600 [Elusimicrobiota bacterium]
MSEKLIRKYKDESAAVYRIDNGSNAETDIRSYAVSTRETRDLMNYPEIVNIDFTEKMRNGVTTALKGLNHLEKLSSINSQNVNIFHILRGGLNFQLSSALNKAYGYKWHSSSYISSQRILKEGKFEIAEDLYRKFIVPDQATIYTADIVASGVSLDNSLKYLDAYMDSKGYAIKNFIFFTIGCGEALRVLKKWHARFLEKYPDYERTILCYLEGKFALAGSETPLSNVIPDTDLLKNYKYDALLTPEFEHSQFEKMMTAMEACVIYDGGKKGFEPANHIKDILGFWEKQLGTAQEKNLSVWEEYTARFPLDHYFENIIELKPGSPEILKKNKEQFWQGLEEDEYEKLFYRFNWLWDKRRLQQASQPGSFSQVCRKKIKYLQSLLGEFS